MEISIESVAHTFVSAINRQDLDGMQALMSPQHRFIDSRGHVITGLAHVRAFWTHYFHLAHDYTIEAHETFTKGPVVVLLGVAQGSFTINGKLERVERWSIPAAFRVFVEEGRITEWRVFADHEPTRKHLRTHHQGEPHPAGAPA